VVLPEPARCPPRLRRKRDSGSRCVLRKGPAVRFHPVNHTGHSRLATAALILAALSLGRSNLLATEPEDTDALVQDLRGLPPQINLGPFSWICAHDSPCSPPPPPPAEVKRRRIYDQLRAYSSAAVPALARGLESPDVSIRSNSALALEVLSERWPRDQTPIDIRAALPALVVALDDPDSMTAGRAAQAIGNMGAYGRPAVPGLVKMLKSTDEGLRNSACIGLRGIGPAAKDALPALEQALSDPSDDVRRFAQLAITSIHGHAGT
jgi:HEAT repeat protein